MASSPFLLLCGLDHYPCCLRNVFPNTWALLWLVFMILGFGFLSFLSFDQIWLSSSNVTDYSLFSHFYAFLFLSLLVVDCRISLLIFLALLQSFSPCSNFVGLVTACPAFLPLFESLNRNYCPFSSFGLEYSFFMSFAVYSLLPPSFSPLDNVLSLLTLPFLVCFSYKSQPALLLFYPECFTPFRSHSPPPLLLHQSLSDILSHSPLPAFPFFPF